MPGGAASALAAAVLAPLVMGGAVNPPWRVATLPQQKAPVTVYRAETAGGREALRVQAQGSYGNLVHDLPGSTAPQRLHWSWRLEQPNPLADLSRKSGDDAAVKVCISFDLSLDRVPFVERQLLKFARSRSAESLPAATLCWVWAGAQARGALLNNAYTARVRYVVLRNDQDPLATWLDEDRDVAADFQRAFGEESAELPPVTAVIVAGDADNTGARSVAHVSALRVQP